MGFIPKDEIFLPISNTVEYKMEKVVFLMKFLKSSVGRGMGPVFPNRTSEGAGKRDV